MEEPDINNYLLKEDLFRLFAVQLKKDFEGAGANSEFCDNLPVAYDSLKRAISEELKTISRSSTLIPSLLYRIDISENQIRDYQVKNELQNFEELLSELIIKRVLQKVILKKSFSTGAGEFNNDKT